MAPTRRTVLGTVAVTIGLAGCTGGPSGQPAPVSTDSPRPPDTSQPAESTPTATPEAASVRVRDDPELGEILVGQNGNTLYMFDRDERGSGVSTCTDGCAENWPPLTVEGEPTAGAGVAAALGTLERADGTRQVTAAGWPLYSFTPDETPADTKGQGVGGAWWVLRPDGTPVRPEPTPTATPVDERPTVGVRSHPDLGEILVGPSGLTLYMFDRDTRGSGTSACSGGCAEAWPPLTVTEQPSVAAAVTASLSTIDRDGGDTQVVAAGWPLYYFASDEAPGDVRGQGVNDAWWVLRPNGEPVRAATPTPTPDDGYVYGVVPRWDGDRVA